MTSEEQEQVDPARVFNELARVFYEQADYEHVYQTLVRVAVELISGCDHASISTMRQGEPMKTAAASDEMAALMDQLENEAGEGPCIDAMLGGGYQRDADIAHNSSWPKLGALTLERTPVRGMIGYRIFVDGRSAGALNLFSDTPGALTQEDADLGALVAAFASVVLVSAAHDHRAQTLKDGLQSNREIGKAIGLLMATHGVDDEQAFELLRHLSSTMNVKLAEVAHRVVEQQRHEQAGKPSSTD
ncbi:MAG TPA: GAF and ANTAR domain-containing protein [Segeticoccus sp.]|uniref:GAF and ANTAR domain-containing protein n=1 Tax=Segeticoccus sp. TaxID=2706531 RepID=UPI002D7E6142|nr:GAF and ANTAR domain-containing protein [Segeticoccus sp.]HET8599256.1 GAF and ANTAR domain-containing protein [Segeticoccus sp.]